MLAAQRRDLLMERLKTDGRIVAKDLAAELGVSEDSIRRDLRELADAGLCQRVYGGALPVSPATADYATRMAVSVAGKERIAKRAAALIRLGSTVILDGGTTALALAKALPADLEATIVTHSPTVAAALVTHPKVEVFLIGGRLFKHSAVTCGAAAAEAAEGINADLFFLGVTGVHPETGLTTGDSDEAAMKRTLAKRAADTYVLASSEKIGAASPFTVLPLSDVAGVITDAAPDEPTVQELGKLGVSVLGVSPSWPAREAAASDA
ncbi:DeoR/GlpR family DNA-binding transcription regulator [Amycolatopsis azurea]|uniref:Lactose phosphotransferase system repressor n=1 Tax=Amycolatopsis azurea DSM 43854 TaxID=1238180 RepID=M2QU78_9PSEU|nr:DeoR/GlpR family DNA-binding transcription regulator [Amycolatopsis azurea]EMD29557.1 Transcriptional regulators of sugar metabolism [Amycolatopsis azurea DSM 43854]OOC02672.1 DeoR family transcriptional regulator [Amycolatopsis azurea DSM 43854]